MQIFFIRCRVAPLPREGIRLIFREKMWFGPIYVVMPRGEDGPAISSV